MHATYSAILWAIMRLTKDVILLIIYVTATMNQFISTKVIICPVYLSVHPSVSLSVSAK